MGALIQDRWSQLAADSPLLSLCLVFTGLAGWLSTVCCGGQDSLLRITDQEQCLFSQIKPDSGVGFQHEYIATIMSLSESV